MLRDELLRVIDAKVALEHEIETLQHQLVFAAEGGGAEESRLTGLRTAAEASTELTGKPAPPSRRAAAPEPGDTAS